jgi:DNA-directed RNA polymerase subunit RPC12/RpoP
MMVRQKLRQQLPKPSQSWMTMTLLSSSPLSSPVQPNWRIDTTRQQQQRQQWRLFMAAAKPKTTFDSYQTVSVNCNKCGLRLFKYKKKNGTKSNLVKLYIERIVDDCASIISDTSNTSNASNTSDTTDDDNDKDWKCPNCQTKFARDAMIHGRPALKLIGGKIRMTKR